MNWRKLMVSLNFLTGILLFVLLNLCCVQCMSKSESPEDPLSVSFTLQPSQGPLPLAVTFKPAVTGGSGKYAYFWSFGDGVTSKENSTSHTFSEIGTYEVSLTVESGKEKRIFKNAVKVSFEKKVSVVGGGGGGELSFNVSKGQKVRITLTADDSTMEPYGHLELAEVMAEYAPANEASKDGVSSAIIEIKNPGEYHYTVFDGANKGGAVLVRISPI